MNKPLILVVEDDNAIKNLITTTLEAHNYKYHVSQTGNSAILEVISNKPDVIFLDLGLPDIDGIEIINKIRSWSNVPIIVISARSEDKDKIEALDAGADDYLTKPFSVDELLARLRVTLRRLNNIKLNTDDENSVFKNGDLKIDYMSGCVYLNEEEIHLTPIEYKLICILSKNIGKVLTHKFITKEVWGSSLESDVSSLRVYMAILRKKIESDTSNPNNKIRSWSNVPIIVISARSEDKDKIEALDAGADDYLTKPFSVDELLARLRVTLRRLNNIKLNTDDENSVFKNGDLKIDYMSGCVYLNEEEIHLTPIEYKLICILSKNIGKVLTHKFITKEVWGSSLESDVSSLRVYMAILRKKIESDTSNPKYIQTHVGVGYRMMKI